MKTIIASVLLMILPLFGMSQEVQGDSLIVLTVDEARTLTKMTEDLKWTKKELQICDSIISHKDTVLKLKDELLMIKELQINEEIKKGKKKSLKTGLISGALGIALGVVLGILIKK